MRPPLPPFTQEAAAQKARLAEDAWNTREPERVAGAYTVDSRWRNRAEFFAGREAIIAFLRRKWARELDYRLIKEIWALGSDRIAVRFAYEWHDDSGHWFRSYGNENWEFDAGGLMRRRMASINDVPITAAENIEGEFVVPTQLARIPGSFMLRVVGDSMIEAAILDGDLILVRPQKTAANGEIVVAMVEGDATVKRFYRESDHIRLQPENAAMEPIRSKEVKVLGRVVGLLREPLPPSSGQKDLGAHVRVIVTTFAERTGVHFSVEESGSSHPVSLVQEGTLELAVLLMLRQRKAYGLEMVDALNLLDLGISEGSIYPLLARRGSLPETSADLMFLESEAVIRTMLDLMGRGIPSYPVHDSIIVPESHAKESRAVFAGRYDEACGIFPRVRVKRAK